MESSKNKTVAVGMSGGVDSTIAAYLLKEQGYNVVGLTMSIWDNSIDIPDIGKSGCYGPGEARDIEAAKDIAKKLGIKHVVVDLSKEYKGTVLKYFCSEYTCGKTPNPCVICNQKVKFGFLMQRAKEMGINYDYFATGHYVRTEYEDNHKRYLLKKAIDSTKDQSYFLSYLKQEQLEKLIFPLGDKTKTEIKELARKIGFTDVADKDESQDFIETDDYSVLFDKGDIKEGDFVDVEGKKIGRHKGIIYYTIGQRKGLGISGGNSGILYVLKIDADTNTIVVGPEKYLFSDELRAANINWISISELTAPMEIRVKIRQQHKEAQAIITPCIGESSKDQATVKFKTPQRAITPGQTVVFYDKDIVIGGGIIL
ncbi:MAG: tRNA 2-thiouridine(34) synthase MnmA [Proteobacteria bacterium]|nr:tRNA 2-thiouridine(34) synthase MnmA [Pseudomonadota bacterium]